MFTTLVYNIGKSQYNCVVPNCIKCNSAPSLRTKNMIKFRKDHPMSILGYYVVCNHCNRVSLEYGVYGRSAFQAIDKTIKDWDKKNNTKTLKGTPTTKIVESKADTLKRFIVVEGGDGTGTTSLAIALKAEFKMRGANVMMTFEPTDEPIGKLIRKILSGGIKKSPEVIAMLFAADRQDHVEDIIAFLKEDVRNVVITDRYKYSSMAYQTQCHELVERLNKDFIEAEFNILLTCDVDTAMGRIGKRGDKKDIYETKAYQKKVAAKYKKVMPEGTLVVDTTYLNQGEVFNLVVEEINKRYGRYTV